MDNQSIPKQNPFVTATLITGLLSLLSICTGILPLPLGALGILFAILSHRKGQRLETPAFVGLLSSIIGMAVALAMLIMSFVTLPSMLRNDTYREQLNSISESMYGVSFDDMLESGYGIDLDELLGLE